MLIPCIFLLFSVLSHLLSPVPPVQTLPAFSSITAMSQSSPFLYTPPVPQGPTFLIPPPPNPMITCHSCQIYTSIFYVYYCWLVVLSPQSAAKQQHLSLSLHHCISLCAFTLNVSSKVHKLFMHNNTSIKQLAFLSFITIKSPCPPPPEKAPGSNSPELPTKDGKYHGRS